MKEIVPRILSQLLRYENAISICGLHAEEAVLANIRHVTLSMKPTLGREHETLGKP